MGSLKGHLLLASGRMTDPNFFRTVVLLIQHDENGAMGLVLNRPLEITVKEACDKALELPCQAEGVIHKGGPCEGPLMVVHAHETAGQMEVAAGVHFTAERQHIEWLLENADEEARFYVGYAGWGPGQLEAEMEIGSWVTLPVEKDELLNGNDPDWSRLMTLATLGQHIDPRRIPEDPSVN